MNRREASQAAIAGAGLAVAYPGLKAIGPVGSDAIQRWRPVVQSIMATYAGDGLWDYEVWFSDESTMQCRLCGGKADVPKVMAWQGRTKEQFVDFVLEQFA